MSRRDTVLKYFDEQKELTDIRTKSGIELFRKGEAKVIFEGDGIPSDISIEAEQISHEFKFGANIFMLDEFECEEKNIIYRKKFAELFNLATVPFYWSDLEPIEGASRFSKDSPKIYRRPAPDLCVEYCKEHKIEPKCHCLNYENFSPEWIRHIPVSEVKKKVEKRFCEISERYASDIPSFEVTNETLQGYDNSRFSPFFACDDFVEWNFKTADRYFPSNRLIINDYNIWDTLGPANRRQYYMQIERLLRNGISHIDSVGFQFHSFGHIENEPSLAAQRYNPKVLFDLMDSYMKLGLNEQITEMTIPAYGDDEENEQIQSILMQNLYRIFFSHPAMEAVIYWNLVDGYAAFAPQGDMTSGENVYFGGLLRFDLSEKPAFRAIKDMIHKEWHTKTVVKASNSEASFRGFYGDYKLNIYVGGKKIQKTITLSKNSDNIFTVKI